MECRGRWRLSLVVICERERLGRAPLGVHITKTVAVYHDKGLF